MRSIDDQPPLTDHTFSHGYLAASYGVELHDLPGWLTETFGNLTVHRHPLTRWAAHRRDHAAVAVIGDPVDLDSGSTDPQWVAANATRILADGGLESALRYVAYLGGRWTALFESGGGLVVVPDFAATQSVYWHHGSGTAFSNYAHLLAEATGAPVNEPYRDLMRNARDLGAKGTIYWPGIETPFSDILPVLPNHALQVPPHGIPEHRRFYPFPETTAPRDPETAYGQFTSLFFRHVGLLCTATDRIGISLTAGTDSRTTLAAAAPHLDPAQALTWTYLDTSKPHAGMAADAGAAVELAQRYGLRHQIVDLRAEGLRAFESPQEAFARAYRRSMQYTPQFRRLSVAYQEQLPAGTVELQSMVAEVGTGFYRRRSGQPTAERLAQLYTAAPFNEHPLVRAAFERYVEYAGLADVQSGPVDWHDLFYLESRLGRWAALRIQEGDLSHRVMLPFNTRGVIEALAGPALEDRVDKQALRRFLAEHEKSA
jgi:hypothetical protein